MQCHFTGHYCITPKPWSVLPCLSVHSRSNAAVFDTPCPPEGGTWIIHADIKATYFIK